MEHILKKLGILCGLQLSYAEYTWFYPDLRVSSRHFSNFLLFQTSLVSNHNKVLEMFSVETDFGCPSSISSARDASPRFHSVTLFLIVERTLHKLLPTLIILWGHDINVSTYENVHFRWFYKETYLLDQSKSSYSFLWHLCQYRRIKILLIARPSLWQAENLSPYSRKWMTIEMFNSL